MSRTTTAAKAAMCLGPRGFMVGQARRKPAPDEVEVAASVNPIDVHRAQSFDKFFQS